MTALQARWVVTDIPASGTLAVRPHASAVASVQRNRILVLERQCVVAIDIAQAFEAAGAQVVGIASDVETALALIARCGSLDGAVLDLDLRCETACSVADELARRGIPFLLLTSCATTEVPDRFAHVTRCEKPFDVDRMVPLLLA